MEKKSIILALLTLATGLLIGYLIFGKSEVSNKEEHIHTKETSVKGEEVWTCSMHPQIRKPKPGKCPICGMELILAEAKSNDNALVFEMTEEAVKIANVETTIVGNSTGANSKGIKLYGKLQADETTTASIVSHIAGRIEQLYVSYVGEDIKKGQKIATIYSADLITAQKELLEAHKVKDVNPKLFDATRNKLKYWKITDKQIQQILNEQKVIESFDIYADHSGVVQEKLVSVGDHLMEGGVLFKIQNLNQLWALFDVYEDELPLVKKGDKIVFTTTSVPNRSFEGKVVFIAPVIDAKTRTASVRVVVNNFKNNLKPEMFVEGSLYRNKSKEKVLTVPKTAVLWTGKRSVVYVKVKDMEVPSFEFREIVLGESTGGDYVVLSGLESGEEVVTKGAFVIDASAQLNNRNSMMNRKVKVEKE